MLNMDDREEYLSSLRHEMYPSLRVSFSNQSCNYSYSSGPIEHSKHTTSVVGPSGQYSPCIGSDTSRLFPVNDDNSVCSRGSRLGRPETPKPNRSPYRSFLQRGSLCSSERPSFQDRYVSAVASSETTIVSSRTHSDVHSRRRRRRILREVQSLLESLVHEEGDESSDSEGQGGRSRSTGSRRRSRIQVTGSTASFKIDPGDTLPSLRELGYDPPHQSPRRGYRRKRPCQPDRYDGRSEPRSWIIHFLKTARVNGWNRETCGLEMDASLTGSAAMITSTLRERSSDIDVLYRHLLLRFGEIGGRGNFATQLRNRSWCKGQETVMEYYNDLEYLCNQSYPGGEVEELALLDIEFLNVEMDLLNRMPAIIKDNKNRKKSVNSNVPPPR